MALLPKFLAYTTIVTGSYVDLDITNNAAYF